MASIFAMLTSFFSSCNADYEKSTNYSPVENDVMKISWNSSGDSNGCIYSYEIINLKGNYKVNIHKQPYHNSKPDITSVKVEKEDLDQLFKHIKKNYTYEKWKDFPLSEVQAMDAATSSVNIEIWTKKGRKSYGVSDNKEFPKGQSKVLFDVREYIHSYAIKNAKTFTINRTSFDGNPVEERLEIDNPGMVKTEIQKKYDFFDSSRNGRRFNLKYVFHGRIPGETKLRFVAKNMSKSIEYKVVVDRDFNLTLENM